MKTIYYNGNVYTGTLPLIQAFSVEGDQFVMTGSDEEVLGTKKEGDELVDLCGQFVCAGFNDSHMHLVGLGRVLHTAHLAQHTDSLSGMIEYLKAYAKEMDIQEGTWLQGNGWNQDYFTDEKRIPTRYDLDEISTDFPIVITRTCGHCLVCNSKALEIAGIDASVEQPNGGVIEVENGELNGRFHDAGMGLITSLIPEATKEDIKDMIVRASAVLNSLGITSCQSHDFGVFGKLGWRDVKEAYEELEKDGLMSVRVYEQSNFKTLEELKEYVEAGNVTGVGSKWYKVGPLKMLGDGSLGARTAFLSRPYADDPNTCGYPVYTEEVMNSMVSYANKHDMQIAIHAIGDACLDQVLHAYELALAEHPRIDHRLGVVHCQISRADQLQKIVDLNLHVYAQSIFLDYDNHIVEARVGKELASTSYSWKTLMDKGVSVSNGSDCPVEMCNALEGIECAVTRMSLDGTGPYLPEQAFTVQEAIDSFTIESAKASFEENVKGRIEEGMLADFVVLEQNPFECEPRKIHEIPIHATYVGGKRVYAK